eukprot:COSAG01_NODE_2752_length_7143_cov_35.819989_2_plen_58_part_00
MVKNTYTATSTHNCFVHGPGLDRDLAGGWNAFTFATTTIGGATGQSGIVCAAVAGRN